MIERYTLPRMKAIWDLRHKYEIWLQVELLACEALERAGEVPRGVSCPYSAEGAHRSGSHRGDRKSRQARCHRLLGVTD